MSTSDIDVPLSVVAATLAVMSFGTEVWRLWRDRPRITFYVLPITFKNVPKLGEMTMLRVIVCNVGYRPIVLTRFVALGEKSIFSMGIDDGRRQHSGLKISAFRLFSNPEILSRFIP